MVPDVLQRVKLRRVGGQPRDRHQPRGVRGPQTGHGREMHTPASEHEDEGPAHMGVEQAEEGPQVWRLNIMRVEAEGEAHARALRRAAQGATDREAVVALPALLDRHLPARRPGAPPGGLQPQAALVEENEVSLTLARFFLTGARSGCASVEWPSRPARGPGVRASGAASAERATPATH